MKENPMIRKILKYGKDQYGTVPDYPWRKTPDAIVLRHVGRPGQCNDYDKRIYI